MTNTVAHNFRVPHARIYCEVRGDGPALLMLTGGSGDANSFDRLANCLADRYTIITFNRRGYARSPIDDDSLSRPTSVSEQSTDAGHILDALSMTEAYVFGSSAGAVIGLELLISQPQKVRHLVAHEPPLGQLLPHNNSAKIEAKPGESASETLHRFAASLGVSRGLAGTATPQSEHNARVFLAREAPAIGRYRIDMAKLQNQRNKITFAAGADGREYFPYQCAESAAQQTQAEFIEFPGRHNGFGVYPSEFAARLDAVLRNE